MGELMGNDWKPADSTRMLANWPYKNDKIKVIIDADAANEVDDQYAIALALGFPQRLQIEGFIAAHFGVRGGMAGIEKSYRSIEEVLQKAGMAGKFQVKKGTMPLTFLDYFPDSEGVDFIIEKAKQASTDDPLLVIALGPATNVAAAVLKDPSITGKLVVLWHGRTKWPDQCWNFNAYNDIKSVQVLFDLPVRLILFDTGTQITMPMDESAKRIMPKGELGKYLHDIRQASHYARQPDKGLFDLGDMVAVIEPSTCRYEIAEAPSVGHDLKYNFATRRGKMVRIFDINRDKSFLLLDEALDNIMIRP